MALPRLTKIRVSQHRHGYVVDWRPMIGSTVPPGTNVRISRSYHQVSGFEEIADVSIVQGLYVDADHHDHSKNVNTFYILEVHLTSDPGPVRSYGPVHILSRADKIGVAITRRMELMLRNLRTVTPVLIYQTAYGGEEDRDQANWDPVTGQAVEDHGPPGGFIGDALGYYNPILTLMDIRPAEHGAQVEDTAQQVRVTSARMSNFPILRTADVVREVNTGRLWIVTHVVPVSNSQGAILTQDPISLRQIKHGDVEYELPVPDEITPILARRRIRQERILQDNPGGTPRFLEVYV